MQLWSDYEGKTIADTYPIGQLIRPEGRSAFFSTSSGPGVPAVIRLTESLNDEAEMISRWRQVAELKQEHLVAIKNYGQTRFESTPLTFALMEPSDASLADILKERPLTPSEAREVALSLVDALLALHAANLVHGHVDPTNVLAVGEVVKLRSDCVRECRLDDEFLTPAECQEFKRLDVQAFAALLLKALTLEDLWTPVIKLPAPFDRIVRHGLDGTWGLKEIDSALNPAVLPAPAVKALMPEGVLAAPARTTAATSRSPLVPPGTVPRRDASTMHIHRIEAPVEPAGHSRLFWIGCGAALLLLVLIGWRALSGRPQKPLPAAAIVSTAPMLAEPESAVKPAPFGVPPHSLAVAHPPVATAGNQAGWHVIAFTYNHEEQAFGKVASIRQKHPALSPEVFSPNGHAPYYVALGGAVSEREAQAMQSRARRDGMPRDTFIRRYGAR